MRKQKTELPNAPLPEGFHFSLFQPGDEHSWADIETSVLEFSHKNEALEYFEGEYLKFPNELSQRCIFITTDFGQKIGTATAWWSTRNKVRIPSIHWVSINPAFQNMGLGKSLVNKAISTSIQMDGDFDSYIHTQTWSYPAIGIYLKSGYKILRDSTFANYQNDFQKALPHLKDKMGSRFDIERDTTTLSYGNELL